MAENQPRRFMLGLALGKGHAIYLYVCVPGGIYIAELGNLPLAGAGKFHSTGSDDPREKEQCVVAFLLFLYNRLGKDYGYLTKRSINVPGSFKLADIVGAIADDRSILPSTTSVTLRHEKRVLGRHGHLKGQRTWAYPARVTCDGNAHNVYFKFQWAFDGDLEVDVHQFVLDRDVPHVPELLYSATINDDRIDVSGRKFKGEAIVMEFVGKNIRSFFDENSIRSPAKVIDVFAGYVHTLVAAANVDDEGRFALHRDISIGNLMVTPNGHPYVIDWGCGCVSTEGVDRPSSGKHMIGTAIYIAIRILEGNKSRSVIDDLESLFLVLCHCVWRKYGKINKHHETLWSGKDIDHTRDARIAWLSNKKKLFERMGTTDDLPKPIRLLVEDMFTLLFPPSSPIYDLNEDDTDPRLKLFKLSAWLEVFENASGCAGRGTPMPHLDELRRYVRDNSDRRVSSIIQPTIQPLNDPEDQPHSPPRSIVERPLNDDKEHSLHTPTRASRSNKRSSTLITLFEGSSLSKRPRIQSSAELDETDTGST
ncbi:hypothetical protein GGI22_006774 [Coemansia erecta]|nr:hypothetical protein GGI22_006774 [Coemansia erecta]